MTKQMISDHKTGRTLSDSSAGYLIHCSPAGRRFGPRTADCRRHTVGGTQKRVSRAVRKPGDEYRNTSHRDTGHAALGMLAEGRSVSRTRLEDGPVPESEEPGKYPRGVR
ncbi:hypothetical protein ITX44_23635 [Streptomyces sp. KK5PA1]|uniref:Uncharacterized protein n=1 Tax=Actinacidiphila acididurans TaxID=2784346 RepID=A0ABS2TVV8_9ACTN|nr:hypothetical protein [Actinacidiphila acididurans]